MTPRNIVMLGALLAIVGCFCPFLHIPIAGSITYMMNGNGDGMWVTGLSVVAFLCAWLRFSVAGLFVGAITGFLLFRVEGVMNETLARMHSASAGAGFLSGFAEALTSAVYLEFGFYIVAAGGALMLLGGIASLFIGRPSKRSAASSEATPDAT